MWLANENIGSKIALEKNGFIWKELVKNIFL